MSNIRLILAFTILSSVAFAETLPDADARFAPVDMNQVRLGQMLFYDPILSGSKTVACATCHHPKFATADGLSLGLGDGAHGLGPERVIDVKNLPEQRVPPNTPALFNLGVREFTIMFHDGRHRLTLPDHPASEHLWGQKWLKGLLQSCQPNQCFRCYHPMKWQVIMPKVIFPKPYGKVF